MQKLNPHYLAGFIDGEGSFNVSVSKHTTTKSRRDIYTAFSIELRGDDRKLLERIQKTIGCGGIYRYDYPKYKWGPHYKYKIGSAKDLAEKLFPLLDKYPLQAKKKEVYKIFRKIIIMKNRKEHLTDKGFKKILDLRDQMRRLGKKAGAYFEYKETSNR